MGQRTPTGEPALVILAGPNGAGKSTTAQELLRGELAIDEFVNADVIAAELSPRHPERVALAAGRLMLERMRQLAERRTSFGFETTLASHSFRPWIADARVQGYRVYLNFIALADHDLAVQRVAERAHRGGHAVPDATVRRRFVAGLTNFFGLYRPIADYWRFYDNSQRSGPLLIARGGRDTVSEVAEPEYWNRVVEKYR